jgi:cyclophilin family peptidyl-prolyl cis-trans isomerase
MAVGGRPARRLTPRIVLGSAVALLLGACVFGGPTPTPHTPCPKEAPSADQATSMLADAFDAVVQTSKGSFTIALYGDKAPIATSNFVALARCGFYDGITFHRVVAGFVIQAGDPQTRQNHGVFDELGTGGPGYSFAIETPAPGLTYDKYVVAIANSLRRDAAGNIISGENSNGSQFFIDLADLPQLPPDYTIFGKVTEGADVVDAIGQLPTNGTPDTGPQNVPLDPVVIQSITVRGKPQPSQG